MPFYSEKCGTHLYVDKHNKFNNNEWNTISEIIHEYYPEYIDAFNKIMQGDKVFYLNMFITTRELFNQYSEWIFSVLKKYDELFDERKLQRPARVDGFLSETLLNVWFMYHLTESEIYRMDVQNIESNRLYLGVGARIKHSIFSSRIGLKVFKNLSLLYKIFKFRSRY